MKPVEIQASPEAVYALVSISRAWGVEPENIGGEWQGGSGGGRTSPAIIGRRAHVVGAGDGHAGRARPVFPVRDRPDASPYVRWTYRLEPSGASTRVTEVWDVEQLPPTLQTWTQEQLAERVRHTEAMLTTTLAALKKTAEG